MLNPKFISQVATFSFGVNPEWSFCGTEEAISSRTTNSDNYRFGYNGSDSYRKESDDETKGSGNSYTTEFRQYDPRIGRWLSLDPLMAQYPMMSPYVAFNNNPIYFVDPLGLEGEDPKNVKYNNLTKGDDGNYYIDKDKTWRSTELNVKSDNAYIKNTETGELEPIQKGSYGVQNTPTGVYTYWDENGNITKQVICSSGFDEYMDKIKESSAPEFIESNGMYTVRSNQTYIGIRNKTIENNIWAEYQGGFGPRNSVFLDNSPLTKDVKSFGHIDQMRFNLYSKYDSKPKVGDSYTEYNGSFGFMGLISAGANKTKQYVGSFSGDVFVSQNGKNLIFIISDAKTIKSLAYRAINVEHSRNSFPLYGNTVQKYIWTEPINNNWLEDFSKKNRSYGQSLLQGIMIGGY